MEIPKIKKIITNSKNSMDGINNDYTQWKRR